MRYVLLKAVKRTDKEISFVILSGGEKKTLDSELKTFSHPIIRGERGKERGKEQWRQREI